MRDCLKNWQEPQKYFTMTCFNSEMGTVLQRQKQVLNNQKGGLKSAKEIMKILGKEGLCDLDFNVSKGKVTSRQATMLNEVEEEIPSASDVDKAGDIELQEMRRAWKI